jgi:hypothetical protein
VTFKRASARQMVAKLSEVGSALRSSAWVRSGCAIT